MYSIAGSDSSLLSALEVLATEIRPYFHTQALFQPPGLVFGAAPEFGRVKDDPVIAAFAPHFARGEFGRVINQPADRAILHPGQGRIVARLGHRFL